MHVLTSFHVAIDETGRQFKDNYLTTTRIVNMASRATLNELPEKGEPLSWEKTPCPESCLRNNFTILYWNNFLNLYTVLLLRCKTKM